MKKIATYLTCSLVCFSQIHSDEAKCSKANLECLSTQDGIDPSAACPAGSNAPARVTLFDSAGKKEVNAFTTASFLYYYASESGLDIANSAMAVGGLTVATSNSTVMFQDFEYKPGFAVGLGANFHEWQILGEYTWIRQTTKTTRDAPTPDPASGPGVWILNNWFQQLSPAGQIISASTVSSRWHLAMDIADITASRPFYQGRKLVVSPSFGIRAAWIRQNVRVGIDVPTAIVADASAEPVYSQNSSNSWGLGPRIGLNTSWLLSKGFRVEGNAAASLLFTQYTKVSHSEQAVSASAIPATLETGFTNFNVVRPEAEIGLGLGWGAYLKNRRYHIDFSAGYDFMIFWEQNMIRKLLDQTLSGSGASPSSLYMQGLNVSARFDF